MEANSTLVTVRCLELIMCYGLPSSPIPPRHGDGGGAKDANGADTEGVSCYTGLQHFPGQELRAQPGVHRGLRQGEDMLHPQRERPHREAELYPGLRLRAVQLQMNMNVVLAGEAQCLSALGWGEGVGGPGGAVSLSRTQVYLLWSGGAVESRSGASVIDASMESWACIIVSEITILLSDVVRFHPTELRTS